LILEHKMAGRRMGFEGVFSPLYAVEHIRTGPLDGTLSVVTCSRSQKSLTIVYYSADPEAARKSILQTQWLQAGEVKIFGAPEPLPAPENL